MLQLRRTVRLCINEPAVDTDGLGDFCSPRHNAFTAWPSMQGLGRYYEIEVVCEGEADPLTGYFINIREIDQAVREHVLPCLIRQIEGNARTREVAMGHLLAEMLRALQSPLGSSVAAVTLVLTPTYRLSMESHAMQMVLIRQRFEFSAAHRLHVPHLDEQRNREIFGKCNNPAGHGHNYVVEVAVSVPICAQGHVLPLHLLEATVDEHAIVKLDHKNLSVDVPAFADRNSSVENISQVVWEMLEKPVGALAQGVLLAEVSVWETGKTVCTYRGASPAQ